MRIATDDFGQGSGIGNPLRRVEQPQLETRGQRARQRPVHIGFRDQPAGDGFRQVLEDLAALQVAAVLQSQRGALGRVRGDLMVFVQVGECAAVRHDMPREAPLAAEESRR